MSSPLVCQNAKDISGHFVEYLLQRPDVRDAWKAHTHHAFVAGLADGTLPVEAFKYYLIQDYLYLVQFARACALAAYKARTMEDIAAVSESNRNAGHC